MGGPAQCRAPVASSVSEPASMAPPEASPGASPMASNQDLLMSLREQGLLCAPEDAPAAPPMDPAAIRAYWEEQRCDPGQPMSDIPAPRPLTPREQLVAELEGLPPGMWDEFDPAEVDGLSRVRGLDLGSAVITHERSKIDIDKDGARPARRPT